MKTKKYLITGGAGFIGSHLSRRLLELGNKVYIIDNLLTGLKENIPDGSVFIKGDISNPKDIKKIPDKDYDCLFHLAAQSSGELSHENPKIDLLTNAYGAILLLGFAQDKSIPRFIYSSSMAVYGDVLKNPVTENTHTNPKSFYGISKLASEHYLRNTNGLDVTIFRLFSAYGPGQNLANMKQGMVSIYLSYLLKNRPIHVKGKKDRFRDFIYIDDVIDAFIRSIDDKKTFGKTYNLGTGIKTTVEKLIDKMLQVFDKFDSNYKVIYKGGTPGDQYGLYADIAQICKDLDWRPKVALEEGLEKMSRWAKQGCNYGD